MKYNLNQLIKEVLSNHNIKSKCNCGCNTCKNVGNPGPILNESINHNFKLSKNLKYHIDNKIALTENTFRYGSEAFLDLWKEARHLYSRSIIHLNENDKQIVTETNIGEYGMYEGILVPLDLPIIEENTKSKNEKKNPPLNKPHRGGSKKFYVYVRDPKTKKIKKVSFGDTTGLSTKINNPKARQAFAKRQQCDKKKDRTKAGYWACNIGRYWKSLGGSKNFSGYW